MDDWQEQVQELQAMTAIYGEDFCVPAGEASLAEVDEKLSSLAEELPPPEGIEAQLLVHLMPASAMLTVKICAAASPTPSTQQDAEFAAQVQHLPPLSLHVVLPPSYPSTQPPEPTLSAFWLSSDQLRALHSQLLQLWDEQGGQAICFVWADWLATSALDHLGISDTLMLQTRAFSPTAGAEAPSGAPAPVATVADSASAAADPPVAACQPAAGELGFREAAGPHHSASTATATAAWPFADTSPATSSTSVPHHSSSPPAPSRGKKRHGRRRNPDTTAGPAAFQSALNHTGGKAPVRSHPQQQSAQAEAQPPPLHAVPGQEHASCSCSQPAASSNIRQSGAGCRSACCSSAAMADGHAASGSAPMCDDCHSPADDGGTNGQPSSAENVLMRMLQYDAGKRAAEYRARTWTCKICLGEVLGSQCLQGAACDHPYCTDCMVQHARSLLAEGAVDRLLCPEPGCKQPLLLQRLRPWLSNEEASRWERLELEHAFARMADMTTCKRCGTPCLEDDDNCAICPTCYFVFCSLCQDSWHPGTQCMTPEGKLHILRERMAGNKASAAALVQKEFELMSLTTIQKTSKPCPVCGMAIQKQEGCNKMVCGACGAFFCYRCGQAISGYEHFANGACVLFEMSEILRWEAQLAQQIAGQAAGGGQPPRRAGASALQRSLCPRCGQANERAGNNNHMACWACAQHYCFLCRAVLGRRGGGLHFGRRGGCQQHTHLPAPAAQAVQA